MDTVLITAAEDAVILVWALADLLRASLGSKPPRPLRTWSDHNLPVTSLFSAECGQHMLVASSSLDQTVRVWRLSESSQGCLFCSNLEVPITCVAVDPAHRALYAGAADGSVFDIPLLRPHDPVSSDDTLRPKPASTVHSTAVHSLCVSIDGEYVYSCASTGGVWVWAARGLVLLERREQQHRFDCLCMVNFPIAAQVSDVFAAEPLLAPLKKYRSVEDETEDQQVIVCIPMHLGAEKRQEPNPVAHRTDRLALLEGYEWANDLMEGGMGYEANVVPHESENERESAELQFELSRLSQLNAELQSCAWTSLVEEPSNP